ncbi:hypothetical protein UY3_03949 [Chelonia mydas]|uniref:Uncharacterized protein n=1 Tax=Chelonia mydas TaxID=8469 RepID=M7BSW7_CHEMY|nr:hypothetical protein UY3_03949 [Chelonia mydas]
MSTLTGDRRCGNRCTGGQFSGSSEDPLNQLQSTLPSTPVLHRKKKRKSTLPSTPVLHRKKKRKGNWLFGERTIDASNMYICRHFRAVCYLITH